MIKEIIESLKDGGITSVSGAYLFTLMGFTEEEVAQAVKDGIITEDTESTIMEYTIN